VRLAAAAVPARTPQTQRAEERPHDNGVTIFVAMWPPTLATRHLLGQRTVDLLLDDNLLHLLEQVLGFGQLQAERVDLQRAAFEVRDLVHHPLSNFCQPRGLEEIRRLPG
jgi:hypothetical protein